LRDDPGRHRQRPGVDAGPIGRVEGELVVERAMIADLFKWSPYLVDFFLGKAR
jgi:hypothetical protein